MKRMLCFFVALIVVLPSYGADTNEICKRKTLTMIVLQKNVNGVVTDTDSSTMRWAVDYDYDLTAKLIEILTTKSPIKLDSEYIIDCNLSNTTQKAYQLSDDYECIFAHTKTSTDTLNPYETRIYKKK